MLIVDVIEGFSAAEQEASQIKCRGTLRWFAFQEFVAGKCGGLIHTTASEENKKMLQRRLGTTAVRAVPLGELRLLCVVNLGNSISNISLEGIGLLLKKAEKPTSWKTVGGIGSKVKCYVEAANSTSREIVQWKCLTWRSKTAGGRHSYRKDVVTCVSPAEIVRKVAADRSGLGLFLYNPNDKELRKALSRVRVLKIGTTDAGPFVDPSLEPVLQVAYPLSESVVMFLHPKAPPVVSEFAKFCVSLPGTKIADSHGLITPWHQKQYEGKLRLAEMKSGKGVRVSAVGIAAGRGALRGMAIEYVRAKEVIQMPYAGVNSDVTSIEAFVRVGADKATTQPADAKVATTAPATTSFVQAGGKELLLLGDRPSRRAMELHGEKWNALGRDKEGRPDGTGPAEYV
ncbi:MAG: hypothetical protein GY794_25295, partial [bacterium]|nr:hypothetical protein [bacterium]